MRDSPLEYRTTIRLYPSIIISGIPLPKRINPCVALIFKDYELKISIRTSTTSSNKISIKGVANQDLIRRFLEIVISETGVYSSIEVIVNYAPRVPLVSLYVAITHGVVRALSGSMDRKELEEIIESELRVDRALGLPVEILTCLRYSTALGRHVVARYGEGYIDLGERRIVKVLDLHKCRDIKFSESIPLADLVTKVVGSIAIEISRAIMDGDVDSLRTLLRYDNAMWYLVYGVLPENPQNKLVPEINGCCELRIEV